MATGVPAWDLLFAPLPGLVLIVTRLGGLLVFVPMISSALIPIRMKVLLSLALGVAIHPVVEMTESVPTSLDLYALLPLLVTELAIGVTIGLIVAIPIMTAQIAGTIMGQQMGLGLAQVFNPAVEIQGDNVGQALFFGAMASFLASGGLDIVYATLIESFMRVPIGAFALRDTPLELVVGVIASGFEVALRVALPVVVILIIESIIVGFIMRTIPTLNIMIFGFPIKILGGVMVTIAGFVIMLNVIVAEMDRSVDAVQDWVHSFP